jgi:formate dehydrogenase major subunit
MPRLTIDEIAVHVNDGATVLDAVTAAGSAVPALCHDSRFAPHGSCRLCMVSIDGGDGPARLVAACSAAALDGAVIRTSSEDIERVRTTTLRLLASRYPSDASHRPQDFAFDQLLKQYGLTDAARGEHHADLIDDTHPLMHVDMSLCITCAKCVRICEELEGRSVWRLVGRGEHTKVVPDSGSTLAASSCVACGACVDTCPTGALRDRSAIEQPQPTSWTTTVCPYCGVGCQTNVGCVNDRIEAVTPLLEAPVNHGHLCVKGRHGHGFVTATDRLTQPMASEGTRWVVITWPEAIERIADGFRRALRNSGPRSIGVLGSARATNEDNYVIQKFARAVLGTNNVDSCARVCHAPSAVGLRTMLGTGAATNSFSDIELAHTFLLVGTNTTENHPVVGNKILAAVRNGAELIVIDPRRTEVAEHATIHLQHRPGMTIWVLNAMASVIVSEGLVNNEFVTSRVDNRAAFESFVASFAPELVAEQCGVAPELIRSAARLYAKGAMAFHGLGLTEHEQGTEGVMALVNLALLTGNLGRPGTGINPLRGQNNVQGAAHMGCEPHYLTGFAPVAGHGERIGAIWGAPVPSEPGLDAMELLDAANAGALAALWVVGWDLSFTQPDASTTHRSLANIDFLVVQDLFLNETARQFAHIVLPAACAFEHDGTFMNSERRVQRVRKVIEPPGDAKPDWEIVADVARAMGRGDLFNYASAEDVWNEVRQVWPGGAGISYARLDHHGGLQWPCPDETHPGTTVLHSDSFVGIGPRTSLRNIQPRALTEQSSGHFPLTLITGRGLFQFNAGTMTSRTAIAELRPTDLLEMSPYDARALSIDSGDLVVIESQHGRTQIHTDVCDRVPPGIVFATCSDPAVWINRLTGPARDDLTHTPAYKVTAVRVDRYGADSSRSANRPTQ